METMTRLLHACTCGDADCSSSSCRKIKDAFLHAVGCEIRSTGGCIRCRNLWDLLMRHAAVCTMSYECPVPRCSELKELMEVQTPQKPAATVICPGAPKKDAATGDRPQFDAEVVGRGTRPVARVLAFNEAT